jgi:hypothetical protein
VGREVMKLKPELLQQQQKEGRDRQCQPAGDVGDEHHELPGGEITEGGNAGTDSSGEPWRAPPEQVMHQVKRFLRLETVRVMSHPFPRGRAGCIPYVCQDLFPHIC